VLLGLTPEEVKVLRLKKIQTHFHSAADSSTTSETAETRTTSRVPMAP